MRHRLHDYTTASGYFVTTVTAQRARLLGSLENGRFYASQYGKIVAECWNQLPQRFPDLTLDAFQLMPDHVHGILIVCHMTRDDEGKLIRYGLSQVMRSLKSASAMLINEARSTPGRRVWQEGYMDRIIRNDAELEKFRGYIQTNPLRTVLPR